VDALVFEFMGLAMLALCVVVLAVPSGPRRGARPSTERTKTLLTRIEGCNYS
jgi:hypothetical protein